MSDKWEFDKLNAAEQERCKKHKEEFSEERLKTLLDKTRSEWYERYNKSYQDGFEALLAEAGWTRFEYCDEYENRIGWEIGACHPGYVMTLSQHISAGLKILVKTDKNCEIQAKEDRLIVRGDWSKLAPNDSFDLDHYRFKLENGVYSVETREPW